MMATAIHSYHFHSGMGHRDSCVKLDGALYGFSSIPASYHGVREGFRLHHCKKRGSGV